jgi:hypothetical protein
MKERLVRFFKELDVFKTFFLLLSVVNFFILVLVTLLLYQFILDDHQIIYATFWVIWAQTWISFSLLVVKLNKNAPILWALSGPIYFFWIVRPQVSSFFF